VSAVKTKMRTIKNSKLREIDLVKKELLESVGKKIIQNLHFI
jgi:hypothetical protein